MLALGTTNFGVVSAHREIISRHHWNSFTGLPARMYKMSRDGLCGYE